MGSAPSAPRRGLCAFHSLVGVEGLLWCFMKHHSHAHPGEGSAHVPHPGEGSVAGILFLRSSHSCAPRRGLCAEGRVDSGRLGRAPARANKNPNLKVRYRQSAFADTSPRAERQRPASPKGVMGIQSFLSNLAVPVPQFQKRLESYTSRPVGIIYLSAKPSCGVCRLSEMGMTIES